MSEYPQPQHAPPSPPRPPQAAAKACCQAAPPGAKFCPTCGSPCAHAGGATPADPQAAAQPAESSQGEPLAELVQAMNARDESPPQPDTAVAAETQPTTCVCGRQRIPDAPYCPWCGQATGSDGNRLHLVWAGADGQRHVSVIGDHEVIIGKAPDSQISLMQDEYASRRHVRIYRVDGMVFMEDLGSSNGTFLRPRRSVALEPGDEILVGTTVLRLEEAKASPAGGASA